MNKTISIDCDGVLHKFSKGWYDGSMYDTAVEGAVHEVNHLIEKGYKIVVCTARDNLKDVEKWMLDQGFDVSEIKVTNKKPKAIAYIDNRGIRFSNWRDIAMYF